MEDKISFTFTKETFEFWEYKLMKSSEGQLECETNKDNEIINVPLDLPDQKVIKNDCVRTQSKERNILPNFIEDLEKMITYYCKTNSILYKQGLNEIMGVFLLTKYYTKYNFSKILRTFSSFIDKYLTNFYHETEFNCFYSSISLVKLLLGYHAPLISNLLEYSLISIEVFATNWVFTMFANKSNLETTLLLWNLLICQNDELLLHFIIVAVLIRNKNSIVSDDICIVPKMLSQIRINDQIEATEIFDLALQLRESTPYSYRILAKKLGLFTRKSEDELKFLRNKIQPGKLIALPIFPSEIFYTNDSEQMECPDTECSQFMNSLQSPNRRTITQVTKNMCFLCKQHNKSKYKIPFVFIDLRQLSDQNTTPLITRSLWYEESFINDPQFSNILINQFFKDRGKIHFVFFTSESSYYTEYESTFYKEKKQKKTFLVPTQGESLISKKSLFNISNTDQALLLKEYDCLKKIIKGFSSNDFPFISFVEGGFKELHAFAVKHNIKLLSHENCELCKSNKQTSPQMKSFKISLNDNIFVNPIYDVENSDISIFRSENDFIGRVYKKAELNEYEDTGTLLYCRMKTESNFSLEKGNELESVVLMLLVSKKISYSDNIQILKKNSIDKQKSDNGTEDDEFILIQKIDVKKISQILTKKRTKNVVRLSFMNTMDEQLTFEFIFENKSVSKSFVTKTNQYINKTVFGWY